MIQLNNVVSTGNTVVSAPKEKEKMVIYKGRKFSRTDIEEIKNQEIAKDKAFSSRNKDIAVTVGIASLSVFIAVMTGLTIINPPTGILFVAILISSALAMSFSAYDFQQKANQSARTIHHMIQKAPFLRGF